MRRLFWLLLLLVFVLFVVGARFQISVRQTPMLSVQPTLSTPRSSAPLARASCRKWLVGTAVSTPLSLSDLARMGCQVRFGAVAVGDSYEWSFDQNDKALQRFVLEQVTDIGIVYNGGQMVNIGEPVVGSIGRDRRILFYVMGVDVSSQTVAILRFSEENDVGYSFVTSLSSLPQSGNSLITMAWQGPYGRLQFFSPGQCVQGPLLHGEVGSATLDSFGEGWGMFGSKTVWVGEKIYPVEGWSDPIADVIATTADGVIAIVADDAISCGGDEQKRVV